MVYVTNIPQETDIWEELSSIVTDGKQPWINFHGYGMSKWSDVIHTAYGHFCATYAYYIYAHRDPTLHKSMTYSGVLDDLYTRYGNPNTRRTVFPIAYSKMGFGLFDFIEWLAYGTQSGAGNIQDADSDIYDWYPATAKTLWNQRLGNPKTYPGWTLVMGETMSPNQTKSYGPYINYVYGAGNKNAISQNILLKDQRTIIQDYAKYKGSPGFRSTPFSDPTGSQAISTMQKMSYGDWKERPYIPNQRYYWRTIKGIVNSPYLNIRDKDDPMFFTFQSGEKAKNTRKRFSPYPTINYDIRYLQIL